MSIRRQTVSSHKIFWSCFALSLFVAGCGQQTPPDARAAEETTLRTLNEQWSKTAGDKDLEGTVSYYSDDASVFPPNAPLASGKQAVHSVWADMIASASAISWQTDKVEVARSGDLAYVTGTYQTTAKDPKAQPVNDTGKFVEVWKKQADGKWKTVADIFNSDVPVPAPAPPVAKKHAHSKQGAHAKHRHTKSKKYV
jgi:ketosteroid isomerase-like protein